MNSEIEILRQRLETLERIAAEHALIERLITAAAHGRNAEGYYGDGVLHADPPTGRVLSANAAALDLLGYASDALLQLTIADLEMPDTDADEPIQSYYANFVQEVVYSGLYKHRSGVLVRLKVYRRLLDKGEGSTLQYRLVDESLYKRVWHEIQRREGEEFGFQQKLEALNELTLELNRLESVDALCRAAVEHGMSHLGFDRLSIWFIDLENQVMRGSYGVDERGAIRNERDQTWIYRRTYIEQFIAGATKASLSYDEAPLFNEQSEIIGYGWHISAPVLHGDRFVGVMAADNHLRNQPMKGYEPELLRLYAITMGHLIELVRAREHAFAMRLQKERNDLLRDFIIQMGHDIRQPLSVISTHSYLMQRVPDDARRERWLTETQEQVNVIGKLLSNTFDYLTMESGPELTLVSVDLRQLMVEVVESHESLRTSKAIRCDFVGEKGSYVPASRDLLRRALSNLYENALHYTEDTGWVQIRFASTPAEVMVQIQDNGVGIQSEDLENIFIPLYRVNTARTERQSGFGLPIAKAIIEAHNGRLTVKSTPGEGSTFEISLPIAQ